MNLTVAITIQNKDGNLIGPNDGCPILYLRGSDDSNDDAYNALVTDEFFKYMLKNKCFADVTSYTNTNIYVSYYEKEDQVKYIKTTLQDAWTFDYLKEYDNRLPGLAWNCLTSALAYIWRASFGVDEEIPLSYDGDLNTSESVNEVIQTYNKIKEKFGDKLSKDTFIQSVNSWLQRREKYNLTEYNISYIVEQLKNILDLGDNG